MKLLTKILLIIFLLPAANLGAGPLPLFSANNSKTIWHSPQAPATRPQHTTAPATPAINFSCPFSKGFERCFWDADLRLDLSDISGISLRVHSAPAGAVSRGTIYLHSGQGWYGGWFQLKGGWENIRIPRAAFGTEDSPSGWGRIDKVRLAFWRGNGLDAKVTVSSPAAWRDSIVQIINSAAFRSNPAEKTSIESAAEDIATWFAGSGIEIGQLNDDDIVKGLPPSCKLAILPYNPFPPATTIKALQKFTARGGKLIVAYVLTPEYRQLLGIKSKDWIRNTPDNKLAAIKFRTSRDLGFPTIMRQDSWNANIPHVTDAGVLAYWQAASGKTTKLPAVTANSNGVYIGHILMDTDRAAKSRFLLAAAIMLRPDLKNELLPKALTAAATLLNLPDWSTTRSFIIETAAANSKKMTKQTATILASIEHYRKNTLEIITKGSTGDILTRIDVLHRMVRQAYFNAVPARPESSELRGIWCHKANGIPGQSWKKTCKAVKANGFNTIFVNLLWPGCAYYPSKVVPPPPATDPAHGNQLTACTAAARKYGIKVLLWKVCWTLAHAQPDYIAKLRKSGRLQQNSSGKILKWLCPSDPRNRKLELDAIIEAARQPGLAGIHLDYIRYPDSSACYCAGCHRRFEAYIKHRITNWPAAVISGRDKESYQSWRRDNITSFVKTARQAVKSINRKLQFSAAVFGSWPSCRETVAQDWVTWARRGYLDFVCPMNYVTDDAKAVDLITKQLKDVAGACPVYPGIGPSARNFPPAQTVHQLDLVRRAGARGFLLFDLDRDLLQKHLPALHAGATAK